MKSVLPLLIVMSFCRIAATAEGQETPSQASLTLDLQSAALPAFEGTGAGEAKELVPGIVFHWCPPGTFQMGTPKTIDTSSSNEGQVNVTLTSGFWIAETEVTQGQWQKLMGTTPWKGGKFAKEGDEYPANYLHYDDAVAFCKEMTNQERDAKRLPAGWKYSLPTEAQWEYACRAGTKTKFSFGDDESKLSEYGWWGSDYGNGNAKGEKYAHRVGQKNANPWGLKDMHGNVWEWCSDWYGDLSGGQDPTGPAASRNRILRGGAFSGFAADCRSARRTGSRQPGSSRSQTYGFRFVAVRE